MNASVKRGSKYPLLDIYRLFELPLKKLLSKQGILLVWMTHRARYHRILTTKLFPAWGLKHVATWHWIKVISFSDLSRLSTVEEITNNGEPVLSFESTHRKPYELIFVAVPINQEKEPPPKDFLIVSVPCTEHSRKPSLLGKFYEADVVELVTVEVMKKLTKQDHLTCLELFARHLQADHVCWGNEPLLHQARAYFCGLN